MQKKEKEKRNKKINALKHPTPQRMEHQHVQVHHMNLYNI